MDGTQTQAPPAGGHQERQLINDRYRLVSFHRADEYTEVWRALDEVNKQVVTLEFLVQRDPARRERFVTEGRRMAAVPNPSVMRVALVHDDAAMTFMVFEHLVHVPVNLDFLKPPDQPAAAAPAPTGRPMIIDDPVRPTVIADPVRPKVIADSVRPTVIDDPRPATAPAPAAVSSFAPSAIPTPAAPAVPPPAAPAVPTPAEPAVATAVPAVASEDHYDHGLPALMAALRARELALIDATVLKEAALEIWQSIRQAVEDLHLEDVRLDTVVSGARELLDRIDLSFITSRFERTADAASTTAEARPRLKVGMPRLSMPGRGAANAEASVSVPKAAPAPRVKVEKVKVPKVKAEKIKVAPAPKIKAPREPRVPGRSFIRVRWGRVLTRGLAVGVLAATVAVVPPDVLARVGDRVLALAGDLAAQAGPAVQNVADQVGPAVTNVANQVGQAVSQRLTPTPPLAKPNFEVPPLSAYGARFETSGPTPKATAPNGTVEWVVALRNTGSASWYRGIEGAQAALALADGTGVAVQSTDYVAPGQLGWFVVHLQAPAQPGTYDIKLLPRIDGRGQLADLNIIAKVTVAANP